MRKISEIAHELRTTTYATCQYLLPNGRQEGSHWRVGGIDGEKGRSLAVDLTEGVFIDQATGEGGDMLELWGLVRGMNVKDAAQDAQNFLCMPEDLPEAPPLPSPSGQMSALLNPFVLNYLHTRGIPRQTVIAYNVGADGKTMLFPRMHSGNMVALKVIPIGNKSGIRQSKGSLNHCFGWQSCQFDGRPLIITEGEIDALSVHAATEGAYDVVSVPAGATNLQWLELDAERLTGYSKIYLWMDNDEAGQSKVGLILDTLGRTRCKSIVSSKKDANEVLIRDGSPAVITEIANAVSSCRMEYVSISPDEAENPNLFMENSINIFPEVDFFAGGTTLLAGANGTGKSTLALQIAHMMSQVGVKPFILSPEMPPKFSAQILVRQTLDKARPSRTDWITACGYVRENFLLSTVEEKLTPDAAIRDFDLAYEAGCRFMLLDSITCVRLSGGDLHLQAEFADMLRVWARSHPDCYTLALAHLRKPAMGNPRIDRYSIRGASEISDMASNIWLLERKNPFNEKDMAFYGNYSSKIIVDKNRQTGKLSQKMLNFFSIQKTFNPANQAPCYLPTQQDNIVKIR